MKFVQPALWPSPRGIWLLLLLCALIALTSVIPAAGVLVLVAAGTAAALILADLRLGPNPRDLELSREASANVAVGRSASLEYRLLNRSPSTIHAELSEAPNPMLSLDDALSVLSVPARAAQACTKRFVALERGLLRLEAVYVRADNAVGILRRRFVLQAPLDVRVFPDLRAVEGYGKLARRSTLLEAGLRKLRLRGAGSEFESLREYEPGDAFRSVDWKASARRGKLMVAQYDVERSQNVIIALDAGRLMTPRIGAQRKFDFALVAALSAARVAGIAGDNVGFVVFAARTLRHIVPRRGIEHHASIVRATYDLQPRLEEPDYETVAADLKRRYTKRSLIVVFTDLFDPTASTAVLGSLVLLAPRHLVLCVLMNDASIAGALAAEPRCAHDAYRAAVALRLDDERRDAIANLRARGILVVDAPAQRLTLALLDAYLGVKARGLL